MEAKLYQDIARSVAAFSFGWSKWNNQRHLERSSVFQIKETIQWKDTISNSSEEVKRLRIQTVTQCLLVIMENLYLSRKKLFLDNTD